MSERYGCTMNNFGDFNNYYDPQMIKRGHPAKVLTLSATQGNKPVEPFNDMMARKKNKMKS